ncbi:EscU/YscU/HrcU family type III secretion system export apparatus switch protein [Rouxiella chamberiensis]|uniref:EscU/YscU/HrcU family type III secretion system export apparatus switch protein n=1 Tax=Rouxiella chamberiensis TaxID=1513468 RepID=UPI0005D36EE8|nr:EscU/YscU/HrcU family type III secretion system export apparatus switch protein [Rouxiella chamberiensis]
MSLTKTEKPTQKKIKDAIKKGQTFKSKDVTISCLIIMGILYLPFLDFVNEMASAWVMAIKDGFQLGISQYTRNVLTLALKIILPFLLICFFFSALPSLLQTGFAMATKVFKFNIAALNPVNGFKKLFSMRTVKDAIKTSLYLCVFIIVVQFLWYENKTLIFLQINTTAQEMIFTWGQLLQRLVFSCLIGMLAVMVLDAVAEYFLYIKELKMDKQEVKRERKDQDGNPEVKSMRRGLHAEILNEQTKLDIANSKLIIANPTHIAIGIYFNTDIVPIPFISLIETNGCAQAVKSYAKKMGVPIIENINLARRIYRTHSRYSFVNLDELDAVLQILFWLEQVDNHWREDNDKDEEAQSPIQKTDFLSNERYL